MKIFSLANYFCQWLIQSLILWIKRQAKWTGNIYSINFLIAFECFLFLSKLLRQIKTKYVIWNPSMVLWYYQVDSLSKKLRRANGALSKLHHYVPRSLLISVYHSIFSSHLIYGCQIWGQRKTYITNWIFLLQKTALRIILVLLILFLQITTSSQFLI